MATILVVDPDAATRTLLDGADADLLLLEPASRPGLATGRPGRRRT